MSTKTDLGATIANNFCLSPKYKRLWKRTLKHIPNGVQTLSKMPSKFVEGVYPIYLEGGNGCYVWDANGEGFIDYPCSLGANLLGHANADVNKAVKNRIDEGILFTLPSILETELAEKICKIIPCAEQVRFLKTGSEATSAAVRIARAYTGKMGIAYCGYHGWHDWFTVDTPKNKGIPIEFKDFVSKFSYNDIKSLNDIFDKDDIGVVILEPYIYEPPQDNFLQKVVNLAHKNGAVVIFDEVVTGFRTKGLSAQKKFGVVPDLCTLGKAMGNGFPISAVCGKKKIMEVLEGDCFVSTTFGGDLVGITAALATLDILKREPVIDHIEQMGEILKEGYNEIARRESIDTKCIGFPARTMFMFPSNAHKGLFWQECVKRGALFGYAQFITYAHEEDDLLYTLDVIKDALMVVKRNWDNPQKALRGECPVEVFRLLVTEKKNG